MTGRLPTLVFDRVLVARLASTPPWPPSRKSNVACRSTAPRRSSEESDSLLARQRVDLGYRPTNGDLVAEMVGMSHFSLHSLQMVQRAIVGGKKLSVDELRFVIVARCGLLAVSKRTAHNILEHFVKEESSRAGRDRARTGRPEHWPPLRAVGRVAAHARRQNPERAILCVTIQSVCVSAVV